MPILLIFLLLIPGCLSAEPLRVALLLEHEQPSAWTNLLRSGLEQSASSGVNTEVIVLPPDEKQIENFRKAAAGHDLVLIASDGLHEILRDNAANYRRVKFGVIDAGIRAPNIMSVTFADEQASFLAGAAGALLAAKKNPENPVIGWLSGADTPAMRSLFNGYSEGAMLAKPGVRVIQAIAESFTDPAAAANKAKWLIESGANVLALAAGAGNPAARKAAEAKNIPVIELDASDGAPNFGVITKAADKAVEEIVNAAANGAFKGKEIIQYNLKNGGVDFKKGTHPQGAYSPEIIRRLGELRREIEKDAIKLRSLRRRTLCDCLD